MGPVRQKDITEKFSLEQKFNNIPGYIKSTRKNSETTWMYIFETHKIQKYGISAVSALRGVQI